MSKLEVVFSIRFKGLGSKKERMMFQNCLCLCVYICLGDCSVISESAGGFILLIFWVGKFSFNSRFPNKVSFRIHKE